MKQQTLGECLSRKRMRCPGADLRSGTISAQKRLNASGRTEAGHSGSVSTLQDGVKEVNLPVERHEIDSTRRAKTGNESNAMENAGKSITKGNEEAVRLAAPVPPRRSRRLRGEFNRHHRPLYLEESDFEEECDAQTCQASQPLVSSRPVREKTASTSPPTSQCNTTAHSNVPSGPSLRALLRDAELGTYISQSMLMRLGSSLIVTRERNAPALEADALFQNADGLLQRVYTLALHRSGSESMVAAGGRGGIVASLPFPEVAEHIDPFAYDPTPATGVAAHWARVLHDSWVSDVCFAAQGTVIVSAANDGFVHCTNARDGTIRASLHETSASIYSMHVCANDNIAIAAKDGSVALCRIAQSAILREHSIVGAHVGVAKCVRWRPDGRVVVTCGNDKAVRWFDVRDYSRTPALEIADAHSCVVNSVAFHPVDQNIFLSSAYDGFLQVFDARRTEQPLMRSRAHHGHNLKRVNGLFHPSFFTNGETILTSGDKAVAITQYSTRTGEVLSTIPLFQAPPTVIAADDETRSLVIPAGTGKLVALRPSLGTGVD